MDRLPFQVVLTTLLYCALSGGVQAQASATSRLCNAPWPCVPVAGTVVFEPGAMPPAEARIRLLIRTADSGIDDIELRATAPDYQFIFNIPRGLTARFNLTGLPSPWLNDRAVSLSPTGTGDSVMLRSDPGVQVTATFGFPSGTVSPPSFDARVARSRGDVFFTPVAVASGQFSFLVRPGTPYVVDAAPPGFGAVRVEFPGQPGPHAVVVDVDQLPRPAAQTVVLVEATPRGFIGSRLLPIVLSGRSPSGGGELPYTGSVTPQSGDLGAFRYGDLALTGPRQRIALAWALLRDDSVANGTRSGMIRFTPTEPGLPAVPDINVAIIDDEAAERPPILSVVGIEAAPCCDGVEGMVRRLEGGPGEGWRLTLELDRPAPAGGAEVTVDTVSYLEAFDPFFRRGYAAEGVDFQPLVAQRVSFAPGTRTATVQVDGIGNDRVEGERFFFLAFTDPRGLAPRDPSIQLRIVDDEVDLSPAARPDLLPVTPLPRANILEVLANDVVVPARYPSGRLEILEPPSFGTATVDSRGTLSPVDDRILYTPQAGRAGQTDRLRYRLCDVFEEFCLSARVEVPIRPVPMSPATFAPGIESGFRDLVFRGLPAMPDARVEALARALDPTEIVTGTVVPNAPSRFALTWNANLPFPALPAGQTEVTRTVFAHLQGSALSDLDLHVAYDADGNGVIAESEVLCASASAGTTETCVVRVRQTASGPRELRIAVANPGAIPAGYSLFRGGIDGIGALAGVVATAPTRLGEGEDFPLRLSWRNDASPLGGGVIGFLRLRNADGAALGDVPLAIRLPRVFPQLELVLAKPVALRPGVSVSVGGTAASDPIFIDVPPGTGQMAVSIARPAGALGTMTLSLRRSPLPAGADTAGVARPPAEDANSINRSTAGTVLDVLVAAPPPGRWYMVLGSPSPVTVQVQLTASIPAPLVRPGGYFNPSRSGHGLFLYPAGNDWAGLWYTYSQDGAPVWYYLQAAAPGANGIWSAPIFRSGWNGSRNHLTEVGRATITPTAADAFQFTYVLDGELGSEPFTSFGRGCPSIEGRVVDASGHWFDPARSGTGYSVQLLPNYEFHAVFAYSARGVPRFLVAERASVGAADDTLPLQQLRGFCPLCVRTAFPERSNVGVLRREFVNGQLSRITVDAAFTNGTPGTWVASDAVVPLGGLQGCAAN